jgi:uncharacterized protein YsxB (DUF464 family)
MNKLEPTYLRYVYDGLHKGSINAENASALPQGFIGLFESEFPADISSVERISVLRRLETVDESNNEKVNLLFEALNNKTKEIEESI